MHADTPLTPMIVVDHAQSVDPKFLESLKDFFGSRNIEVKLRQRERGIHNALEWALPALITIWITKSFFDGFLREMGKDGAQALKRLIQEAYAKLRGTPNRACDADELRKLADGAPIESVGHPGPVMDVTVTIPIGDGESQKSITLVFLSGLNDIEVEVAVATAFDNGLPAIQHEFSTQSSSSDKGRSERLIYDKEAGWLSAFEMATKEANAAMTRKPE
jgi:hypothetical protein